MSSRRANARIDGKSRRFLLGARHRAHAVGVFTCAVVTCVAACGGGGGRTRPQASLATTTAAAVAFEPIRAGWAVQTKAARQALRAPIEAFLAKFPKDGDVNLARTYLVFILLDDGDVASADFFLRGLELTTPPGATRDLVTIARAKQLRLMKQPEQAFDLLRPLVGKIVDSPSRALFQEEVSLSAIEAHRDYEAIAYMDAWIRNVSEEDRDAVRSEVASALKKLPDNVLEGSLRAMRARGAASGYGREIQRLVSERLAQVAIERGDPDLARWLVNPEGGAPSLVGSAEGQLGELATSRRGIRTVNGRLIGLLLPTGSNDLRDEAADVMRGVAWALDLPRRNPNASDGTRLSTRDDGGDPERLASTMSDLAGEGAAVVIAALDARSADRAVKWGEANGLPVIVLAVPPSESARDYAFVLGQSRVDELAVLGNALSGHGVSKVAPLVAAGGDTSLGAFASSGLTLLPSVPCDVDPSRAGEARFPVALWKSDKVKGWLVDGPTECARDLIRELSLGGATGTVALTLDAGGTSSRASGLKLIGASTGRIPVIATRAEDIADPELRRFYEHEGVGPGWWMALGHDAAILARAAVASLPLDASSEATEVARRRAAVKTAIATESVHLWTTDGEGLHGAHALSRVLEVVDLPDRRSPSANAPAKR